MEAQELLDKEMLEEQHLVLVKAIVLVVVEALVQRVVKEKLLFQLLQDLVVTAVQDDKYL